MDGMVSGRFPKYSRNPPNPQSGGMAALLGKHALRWFVAPFGGMGDFPKLDKERF